MDPRSSADTPANTMSPEAIDAQIEERLEHLFKYHAPTEETIPKYNAINAAAKEFARTVMKVCPPSADQSAALRLIRDARMTANASVALGGKS